MLGQWTATLSPDRELCWSQSLQVRLAWCIDQVAISVGRLLQGQGARLATAMAVAPAPAVVPHSISAYSHHVPDYCLSLLGFAHMQLCGTPQATALWNIPRVYFLDIKLVYMFLSLSFFFSWSPTWKGTSTFTWVSHAWFWISALAFTESQDPE